MVLTREEKERRVLELHSRRTQIRIIAKELGMSFRDIGAIIDKAEKEKEANGEQARRSFMSTQAYRLFSQGKTPVDVAIELNIREREVTEYYKEYWKLRDLGDLYQIYEAIKHDTHYFVEMFRLAKTAGMGVQHVIKVLTIAKNYLPQVEERYTYLKEEVESLDVKKLNYARVNNELESQVAVTQNALNQSRMLCKDQNTQLANLYSRKIRLEALVENFQNTNEWYLKIRKTMEGKTMPILRGSKILVHFALISLIESMRKDPDKYSYLIYPDMYSFANSTAGYISEYHTTFYAYSSNQQQRPPVNYYTDLDIEMLVEEAEKVYSKLVKDWIDRSIEDYAASLLPSPPRLDEDKNSPQENSI